MTANSAQIRVPSRSEAFMLSLVICVFGSIRAIRASAAPTNLGQRSFYLANKQGLELPVAPFWSEEALRNGIVVQNVEQFISLFRKLREKQPVHVAAFGSSVVQGHSGCYSGTGVAWLSAQLGNGYPRPGCEHKKSARWRHSPGWMTQLMTALNQTWPHPEHAYYNNGRAGATLGEFVHSGCYESAIPDPVDLVVLENMGCFTLSVHLEQVLWMVYRTTVAAGRPKPPIIMFNTAYVAALGDSAMGKCISYKLCNTTCATTFQHTLHLPRPGTNDTDVEADSFALGRHYGITVISLKRVLASLIAAASDGGASGAGDDGDGTSTSSGRRMVTAAAIGWSPCELLTKLFADSVHPDGLGRVLFGQLIWAALNDALAHLDTSRSPQQSGESRPQQESSGPGPEPEQAADSEVERSGGYSGSTQQTRVAAAGLPDKALFDLGRQMFAKRCYMQAAIYMPPAPPLPPPAPPAPPAAPRIKKWMKKKAAAAQASSLASAVVDQQAGSGEGGAVTAGMVKMSKVAPHQYAAGGAAGATTSTSTSTQAAAGYAVGGGGQQMQQQQQGIVLAAHQLPRSFLPVVSSSGWNFMEYEPHDKLQRHRPGIIATSPGASLTLQLDTTLPGVNVSSTAVVLTYLTSYERMGMAHVECLSGCSCEPQLLDAHRPSAPEGADESGKHKKGTNGVQTPVTYPGSRGRAVKATRTVSASAKVAKLGAVSTSHTAFIPVNPHPLCVLRLSLANSTHSGGHKFKLSGVLVRADARSDFS